MSKNFIHIKKKEDDLWRVSNIPVPFNTLELYQIFGKNMNIDFTFQIGSNSLITILNDFYN